MLQVLVETVEALLPTFAVVFEPACCLLKGCGLEPAGAPLRIAGAGDEPGVLEYAEVLGDGGHAHLEWLGELGD